MESTLYNIDIYRSYIAHLDRVYTSYQALRHRHCNWC